MANSFPKSGVDTTVFLEPQPALVEQCFGDVEHRVIGAAGRERNLLVVEEDLRRANSTLRLGEELAGFLVHAATASSRTFKRNGLCRRRQSARGR